MRLGVAAFFLLAGVATAVADEMAPPPAPSPSAAQRAVTEVTIDRKNQLVGGVGFNGPLGFGATVGLLHGLGADVEEDAATVRAVCAAPLPRCAHGFLLEAGAGSGGGKVSLGVGARARVETEDFHGPAEASLRLSVARTWGTPLGTDSNLTYLGPELGLSVLHVGVDLGVLWRVSGRGGSSAVFSWGFGFRL